MIARVALLALVAGVLLAPSAVAGPRASLPDIEDEVMCPICGTTLELSSAPQAERERELIRRLIDRGADKEEIKDALVAEYGPRVLAVPSKDGFELGAWVMPPAALLLAGGAIAVALWRRRGARDETPAGALATDDAERLERELADYDP